LGAVDYIQKPFLIKELNQKIKAILHNLDKHKNALIMLALTNAYKTVNGNGHEQEIVSGKNQFKESCQRYNLTTREIQITQELAKGHPYKSIADSLSISERTVKTHIQNIYDKVGVCNKLELLNKLGVPNS
jgi:two-component system, sensor histidine kinase ChiS